PPVAPAVVVPDVPPASTSDATSGTATPGATGGTSGTTTAGATGGTSGTTTAGATGGTSGTMTPRGTVDWSRFDAAWERCVVVDVETTGLDPATDRIIECAVLVVDRGEVRRTHSALVNPGRPLPEVITGITGMVDSDLADAPRADAALPRILDLIGDLPLLGHNVAFDIAFLEAEAHRAGVDLPTGGRPGPRMRDRAVCTAAAARAVIPRSAVGRYRLSTLSEYIEARHRPTHRAVDDALATLELYRVLRRHRRRPDPRWVPTGPSTATP
ncbi:3'-5' exonuclease, partial [Corynebacterium bovis]|uniref:3'-5' exonuclease n=1 Tax=Corynebacterium bovis TaxID=36808 RepID=UPI00264AED42